MFGEFRTADVKIEGPPATVMGITVECAVIPLDNKPAYG